MVTIFSDDTKASYKRRTLISLWELSSSWVILSVDNVTVKDQALYQFIYEDGHLTIQLETRLSPNSWIYETLRQLTCPRNRCV